MPDTPQNDTESGAKKLEHIRSDMASHFESVAMENEQLKRRIEKNRQRVRHYSYAGVAGFMLSLIASSFFNYDNPKSFAVLIATFFALVVMSLLIYLTPNRDRTASETRAHLRKRGDTIIIGKSESGSTAIASFSEEQKNQIVADVQNKLLNESSRDFISRIYSTLEEKASDHHIDRMFLGSQRRMHFEIQSLGKRGNLNLTFGILTTLSGLGVLGYSVFYMPHTLSGIDIGMYYIPRLSLVVLIEIFAYFFLSLYKQSLSEIKYFQNELTNIELKGISLSIANRSGDRSIRARLVDEFCRTERNPHPIPAQIAAEGKKEGQSSQINDLIASIKDALPKKD